MARPSAPPPDPRPHLDDESCRLLFTAHPTPLYIYDRDTLAFLDVNEAAIAQYGYTRPEFLARRLTDLRPPEEVPRLLAHLREKPDGYAEPGRWHHRRRDGSLFPVEIVTHTLTFQGRRAEMVMATDVSAQVAALANLRESEERFRLLSRATSDAIWDWNVATGAIWWSEGFADLVGSRRAPTQASLEDWVSRLHPEDRDEVVTGLQLAMAGSGERWEAEYRFARLDGSYAVVRDRAYFIRSDRGEVTRAIGGVADLSPGRDAERLLRDHQVRHASTYAALTWLTRREILEATDLGATLRQITAKAAETLQVDRVSVWRFNPDRSAIECDSLYHQPTQTHSSGMQLRKADYPEYFRAMAAAEVVVANDARTDPRTREFTPGYLTPLGITAMLDAPILVGGSLTGVLCHEHVGEPREWTPDEQSFAVSVANLVALVLTRDAQRRAKRQLREQASLLDQAQDAIMVWDAAGRVRFWNRGAERVYGWSAAEAGGRPVAGLLCPSHGPLCAALEAVQQHGEWSGELQHRTRSGGTVLVLARLRRLQERTDEAPAILAICTDLTEHKKLERQFLRAQRLESIGILAGGIAHDLNNVLAPILMSIEVLRAEEHAPARLEVLDSIADSAQHGAEMIRQVLSFARGIEGQRVSIDAGRLLRRIETVVADTFLKRIKVEVSVEDGIPPVSGDLTQLHQVLMNLCVNARDAMPDGGHLRLAARQVHLDPTHGLIDAEGPAGPHVVLEVSDTGIGMPASVVERIFDPFFTTKAPGQGTGLGLSTSLALVQGHGGFMRVYSEPGEGTTFRVYLPAEAGALPVEAPNVPVTTPRGNGELVLVVDDESAIRNITRQMLERFGYRVVTAAEGGEAVEVYARHREEVALVLTDMRMPGVDGATLIRQLRKVDPALPIVGASGMQAGWDQAYLAGLGVNQLLSKPFTAGELLRTIRACLEPDSPHQGIAQPAI